MVETSVYNILCGVRWLLQAEESWSRQSGAFDAEGNQVVALSTRATSFSLPVAVMRYTESYLPGREVRRVCEALLNGIRAYYGLDPIQFPITTSTQHYFLSGVTIEQREDVVGSVAKFNEHPSTTHAVIMLVIQFAIEAQPEYLQAR